MMVGVPVSLHPRLSITLLFMNIQVWMANELDLKQCCMLMYPQRTGRPRKTRTVILVNKCFQLLVY